jgi:pyrroline-5-carboxylate reductase
LEPIYSVNGIHEKITTRQEQGMKIAFIGGGNMATALIGGLYASQDQVEQIQVADPSQDVKERLEGQWPVKCFSSAPEAISGMDTIVLAVKPQILPVVLDELGGLPAPDQLVISIVAGITVSRISEQLGASQPIVRTMPNTPALIGLGITALYASEVCSLDQRQKADNLMQAGGETVWLDNENLMNVVTAVSGSGPAYFFYLIEAMRNAGIRLGLREDVAGKLALHTAYGASAMAVDGGVDVAELRRRVASKGGTTEAALETFATGGFENLVDSAITAATQRGMELAGNASQTMETKT